MYLDYLHGTSSVKWSNRTSFGQFFQTKLDQYFDEHKNVPRLPNICILKRSAGTGLYAQLMCLTKHIIFLFIFVMRNI